jgi:hypothetical protein
MELLNCVCGRVPLAEPSQQNIKWCFLQPISLEMRCTVPVPIPSDLATFKIPIPFASCFRNITGRGFADQASRSVEVTSPRNSRDKDTALTTRANGHDALQSLALIFFFFSAFLRRRRLGRLSLSCNRLSILKGSYFIKVFEGRLRGSLRKRN